MIRESKLENSYDSLTPADSSLLDFPPPKRCKETMYFVCNKNRFEKSMWGEEVTPLLESHAHTNFKFAKGVLENSEPVRKFCSRKT